MKLNNNLNNIVADVINHKLYNNKDIYLELSGSYLKLSVANSKAPYIGTITEAKIIEKPRPLRPASNEAKTLDDCKIRITRGLTKEIANTHYQFEKVLDPNVFTARELVNIQTLRMREHVNSWKKAEQTNSQWADVCYGDEAIILSAIFGISEQTRALSKTYFGATKQTSVDQVFHRYAVIFGYPYYFRGQPEKNIQDVVSEVNINREKGIKHVCAQNRKYASDVIIQVDSDLNIHKFFRNGQYEFISC